MLSRDWAKSINFPVSPPGLTEIVGTGSGLTLLGSSPAGAEMTSPARLKAGSGFALLGSEAAPARDEAVAACAEGDADAAGLPPDAAPPCRAVAIASLVLGPTIPSAAKPLASWNFLIAPSVIASLTPSILPGS